MPATVFMPEATPPEPPLPMNEPPAPPDAFVAASGTLQAAPGEAAPRREGWNLLETSTGMLIVIESAANNTIGRSPLNAIFAVTLIVFPTMMQASGCPAAFQLAGCIGSHLPLLSVRTVIGKSNTVAAVGSIGTQTCQPVGPRQKPEFGISPPPPPPSIL